MKFLQTLFFISICMLSISCKKKDIVAKEKIGTRESNVFYLKDSFAVKNLKGDDVYRRIWVYLPINYKKSREEYPVIYMHDAQNLFDKNTSYAGEWKVDETLNKIFKETGKSFIVVGINNNGKERLNEYSPWKNEKYGGGSGDSYLQTLINDIKPLIDKKYRTIKDAESTGIIGSSMGGLISYYAGLKHSNVFGKIGVFSPSFWFSDSVLDFTKENASLSKTKMYFLLGEKEGMEKEFNKVSDLLINNGFKKDNFFKKIVPGREHNEAFWASEFENAIKWLYNINKYESTNSK